MSHPWRDHVTEAYALARLVWEEECERVCVGYATEESEFRLTNPPPTFKAFLLQSKGWAHV